MKFLEMEKKNQRLMNQSLSSNKLENNNSNNNIKIENTTEVKPEIPET